MRKYQIFLLLISVLTLNAQERFEFTHRQMGTQIRVVFYAPNQKMADSVVKVVFSRIDGLNSILSDYIEESELNRVCRQPKRNVEVSHDLYEVLFESIKISKATEGAFDITLGPLVRLWRKARRSKILPKDTEIKNALRRVGYQNITFPTKNVVKLEMDNMQLDLGGIGKGFAADEALKVFYLSGISSALIDMGGDIVVSDPPPGKEGWTVAFYYFNEKGEEIAQKVKLKKQAVATSGDLYQFLEIDGARYSHIVDPMTGMALRTNIQVTTIAPNATLADAYASALSVKGVNGSKKIVDSIKGLEAFIIQRSKEGYLKWNSKNFHDFTHN